MLKVLIAEDNVILADILEDFLNGQDFEVCGLARTADEAVSLANLHHPDVAVLDFRLADGARGSDVRTRLQDNDQMGILFVSGDPLKKILTTADGEAYIQKPYGMNDLARALRIVHNLKLTGHVSSAPFPKGFNLLRENISSYPTAA